MFELIYIYRECWSRSQSPASRRRDRSREPHEQSRDSRHSRSLDTRRQDRKQSSSKDTVHSRRWVTDTALSDSVTVVMA